MKASVPAVAPLTPPETGASTWSIPAATAVSCTARASSTEMVDESMNSVPFSACASTSS